MTLKELNAQRRNLAENIQTLKDEIIELKEATINTKIMLRKIQQEKKVIMAEIKQVKQTRETGGGPATALAA